MNGNVVYVNGRLVGADAPVITVRDRGILYGDGLYETIRVRSGRPLRFERHMERLREGAVVLGVNEAVCSIDFGAAIVELLAANGLADARVRITITRGEGAGTGDMRTSDAGAPTVIITANALAPPSREPIRAIISSFARDETSPLVRVKSTNCLASVLALAEAVRVGADNAILLNRAGNVAEATSANVFVVKGTRLMTPSPNEGCLAGTVRAAVLELAEGLGLESVECVVSRDMLLASDEVFMTSAIRLIRFVAETDGKTVGCGEHAVTGRILDALLAGEHSD